MSVPQDAAPVPEERPIGVETTDTSLKFGGRGLHPKGSDTGDDQPDTVFPFEFTARAGEYFRIWIVNIALTILTLGIYSAWAKVRRLRYFHGCTRLDGTAFQYFADPVAILRGRALAVLALGSYWYASTFHPQAVLPVVAVIALIFPWALARSLAFQARYTAFRNIRFSYRGRYLPLALVFLGWPLLMAVLMLGAFWLQGFDFVAAMKGDAAAAAASGMPGSWTFAIPLAMLLTLPAFLYLQKRQVVGNRAFGAAEFAFEARVSAFYKLALILLGLFVLGFVLLVAFVGVSVALSGSGKWAGPVAGFVASLVLFSVLGSAYAALSRNIVINATHVGSLRLSSRLKVLEVAGIYLTNVVAIVLSLGLLIPWAKVRMMRYQMARTAVIAKEGLGVCRGRPESRVAAVGEELGEAFGLDVSI